VGDCNACCPQRIGTSRSLVMQIAYAEDNPNNARPSDRVYAGGCAADVGAWFQCDVQRCTARFGSRLGKGSYFCVIPATAAVMPFANLVPTLVDDDAPHQWIWRYTSVPPNGKCRGAIEP